MSSNQSDGAVVTGAASGIGRAIAAGLAADGFSVVVADLDEVKGRGAAKEIAASNQGRAIFQRVDVTERTSVSAAIDACTAVHAVSLKAGDTVVISGAAGGVGSIAVQLAKILGAKVIGLASAANHTWLADHGVIPVAYGKGVADRIRAASGGKVDAFIDTFGGGYVDLALELGVAPDRIDTIIDFAAAAKHGVKTEGNSAAANAKVLAERAGLPYRARWWPP
jgi:NADPH:quinone reductase-like Zn-dependent oxidoreductase